MKRTRRSATGSPLRRHRTALAYCELLSTAYLEKLTGAQGDAALTECEDQVSQGKGDLPLLISSGPAKPRGENAADVPLEATVPSGTVSLVKRGWRLQDRQRRSGFRAST